jgi:hypothetical protein
MAKFAGRLAAGIAWVVGSLLAWAIPCNLFAFTIDYLVRRGARIPAELYMIYNIVAISGCLCILPFVAVLAIRGKLPWTASWHSVEPSAVPDRDSS